jgi:hypothetical protein
MKAQNYQVGKISSAQKPNVELAIQPETSNRKIQIVVILYQKNNQKTHSIEKNVHAYLFKTTPVPGICCDQNSTFFVFLQLVILFVLFE